jgi:hypothetical protein
MEEPKHDFDGVTDRLKDYINVRVELIKLKAVEKGVGIAASVITYVLIAIFAIFMLLTAILALGFYLGEVTGSNAAGFGLLTGILLVIVVILFVIKDKSIIKPIENKFIVNIFKNW